MAKKVKFGRKPKGSKKSAVKTVSSWDSRKEFISDLKLK